MSGTILNRRLWVFLAIGLALVVLGGPFAWWYRPLSTTERQLVGTWQFTSGPEALFDEFTFTSGRTFSGVSAVRGGAFVEGTWRGAGGEVFLFTPSIVQPSWNTLEVYLKLAFSGQLHEEAGRFSVKFSGSNLIIVPPGGGEKSVWKRVR